MSRNHKIIIGIVVGLAIVGVAIAVWSMSTGKQQVSTDEPVDVVHSLYRPWLEAAQSTTTDPYQEEIGALPFLSKKLQKRLKAPQDGLDPVLCQTVVPEKISTRRVYEGADKTEILVTASKPSTSTEQAIITLLPLDGGWYIDDIRCSPGEFPPEREFTFDREGHLLKSVPLPLDSQYWHIIFEQGGQPGHFAPLFFSATSTCLSRNGDSAVCDPDTFVETSKVRVQGEMIETGVEVKVMQLVK